MKEKLQHFCLQIWQSKFTWKLLFVVATIPYAISLWQGGIQYCDSAYYLLYVAKIGEGLIPYQDIALGYPPLWFYLMYALSAPFGISAYTPEYFLFIHFLFVAGNAICVYFITKYFSQNRSLSLFASWLYLISCYWLEGCFILLEVPSTFFGLLASCFILYHSKHSNGWFVLYGVVAACAFWTKQYGFGYFFLCALLIIFQKRHWQKLGFYILGYVFTFIVCFSIWGENILHLVITDYGTKSGAEAGFDKSLTGILITYTDFMLWLIKKCAPALPLALILLFIPFKDKSKLCEWLFCLCGFFGFSLQFIFNTNAHYCLYLVPFGIILMMLMSTYLKQISNPLFRNGMLALYVLFMGATIGTNMNKTFRRRLCEVTQEVSIRDKQNKQAAEVIKQHINNDETIWIVHDLLIPVYYYGQFTPPNLKTRGYSFGGLAINEEEAWNNIHNANYVFKYNNPSYDYLFIDSINTFLDQHYAIPIDSISTLYHMHKTRHNQ